MDLLNETYFATIYTMSIISITLIGFIITKGIQINLKKKIQAILLFITINISISSIALTYFNNKSSYLENYLIGSYFLFAYFVIYNKKIINKPLRIFFNSLLFLKVLSPSKIFSEIYGFYLLEAIHIFLLFIAFYFLIIDYFIEKSNK